MGEEEEIHPVFGGTMAGSCSLGSMNYGMWGLSGIGCGVSPKAVPGYKMGIAV